MEKYDALIVGGGPAGSTAAWRLSKSGLKVAVIDRAVFPREKVCGGWITPAVLDLLELDPESYGKNHVCQPISGFMTALLPGKPVRTDYSRPVSYGIRRVEFDDFLLKRSGAVLKLGEPVHAIRREGSLWQINGMMEAPVLIGAGGHLCPVAKFLGADNHRKERVVAAREVEFLLDPETAAAVHIDPRIPHLYFCHDLKGYGWCFRKGQYLNVGMGREDSERLNENLESWIQELKGRGVIPSGLAFNFKGHAYLLRSASVRPLAADGVLLAGDSAGLAFSKSGEGILPAVESGLLAAETIIEAGEKCEDRVILSYEQKMIKRFGPGGRGNGTNLPDHPWRRFIAKGLMASRWFVRRWVLDFGFLHAGLSPLQLTEQS